MSPREVPLNVGPGHEGAHPRGRGHIRASDVDRELTIDVLKAAFMQGRLTKDELAERVGQALAGRTYTDLDSLTADIPRDLAAQRPRFAPARIQAHAAGSIGPRHTSSSDRAFVATAWVSGLTILAAFVLNAGAVSGLLALVGIVSGLVSMMLLAAHVRAVRRDERQAGQPPSNRPGGTITRAGPPAIEQRAF
jgi:Domain of unknown function (DUF1707)